MFDALDIFNRGSDGSKLWVEAVQNIQTAKLRIGELNASSPGNYVIFSQKSQSFIEPDSIEELKEMATVRVLLADDNEHIKKLIRFILSSRSTIDICGDAADGKEAVERAAELKPDLVMLDLSMPSGGLEAARQIVAIRPKTRILLLSAHDGGREFAKEAKSAGVLGFVRKDQADVTLLKAVDCVLGGQTYFPT
jgi:CheY-like chemotaxis protein